LEEESAGFDTANYEIAGDGGGLRGTCLAEAFLAGLVGDGGVLEGPFSTRRLGIAGGER
jgi:hypothetical protein